MGGFPIQELAERLRQLQDELTHLAYRIPSLVREVEEIRRGVSGQPADAVSGPLEASERSLEPGDD